MVHFKKLFSQEQVKLLAAGVGIDDPFMIPPLSKASLTDVFEKEVNIYMSNGMLSRGPESLKKETSNRQ